MLVRLLLLHFSFVQSVPEESRKAEAGYHLSGDAQRTERFQTKFLLVYFFSRCPLLSFPHFTFMSAINTPLASPLFTPIGTPSDSPLATPFDSPAMKAAEPPLPKAEDVHLILSDVDGTLFTDDHEIHPRYAAAIPEIEK